MKIECPSCHLTGNINDVDVPPEGRNFECPRCKTGFFVEKSAPVTEDGYLMSMCPVCQYSTFTDEMFAVCPQCGTRGSDYRERLLRKSGTKQPESPRGTLCPEETAAPLDSGQMLHDYEQMNRSRRNPDLDVEPPEEKVTKKSTLPLPIRIAGGASIAVGCIFLLYGITGLSHYYGKDVQDVLAMPYIEMSSKLWLFFRFACFPWLRILFGIGFIVIASQYFFLRPWVPKTLNGLCRGGIGFMLVQEAAGIVNRIIAASGSPSFIFYVDCLMGFLLTVCLGSAPFLGLIWLLKRHEVVREYLDALPSPEKSG